MTNEVVIDGVDLSAPAPGRLFPPKAFTSPAIFDTEMERIFAKSWVHVADTTDLQSPGDFVASKIGDTPVVTVRGEDGRIRTFLNACRHRGAMIAEGRGNCGRSLNCPYHAWSFATDGKLLGIPDREEFSCDPAKMGLVEVRSGTAAPLVFACLDDGAPDFETWLGWLPPLLTEARGAQMQFAFEYVYDVDVNWKVYVENGLDGYHVRFVHDSLDDFVETKSARNFLDEYGSHTHAFIKPEFAELAPPAPHLTVGGRLVTDFGMVFPNIIPVLSPTDFSYLRIDPLSPEKIRLTARAFMYDAADDEMVEFLRDSFDRTNRQDIAVVERVQQGLHARGLPAGSHAGFLELRIGHFERMVARAMSGDWSRRVAEPGPIMRDERIQRVA